METICTKRNWFFIIYVMIFAGVGGVLYGYDIGVISGALPFLKQEIQLSPDQLSIIVAAVLGGGSIATLVSGALADKFGRRPMIILAALVFIFGIFLLINAQSYSIVLLGRLVQGVGVGIVTIVIPLYLVESVPSRFRGRGIAIFQCFLTAGIMLASVIDLRLIESGDWRKMFSFALVPAAILLIGTLGLSESPRWLFKKEKFAKAQKALARCNEQEEVKREMAEMQNLSQGVNQARSLIFQKRYFIPFLLALAIACLNQLTGINSFLQFSTYMLQQSGLSSHFVSMLGTVGITLTNFLVTILAFFLIDKVGRKKLMCIGTAGIVLSLLAVGAFAHFMLPGLMQGYLTVAGMLVYIFCFAIGPGVVVWLAISEILPTAIRGNGMAICLFANSLVSTVLAGAFMRIAESWGYAADFWLCAFFTIFYFFIVYRYFPESKEKTLEEVEEEFRKKYQ